ncbi:NACHT domain- and WD repeat-containing protein 1 [Ambystoma mexicanum]|uniref:NACHT domain- and WD repeat-containing protein 1 n=1 Tax=Ambystoma mexicanum TaxID=8296 RepID=UPI0037E97F38
MSFQGLTPEKRRDLLCGKMVELPPESSKLVRVFISSTFADMATERDILLEKAYPEVQAFCQKHGLVFEVVDMRWGVRDDAAVDHMTTELCLKEIESCQKMSVGPSFIALIGNRYGYRPVPRVIDEMEYGILYGRMQGDDGAIQLLDQWFWKDENAVPPVYVLQPITTHLPHYDDKDPSHREQQQSDVKVWREVERRLAAILRQAAQQAEEDGMFSKSQKHKYYKSVTEWEIEYGLLTLDASEFCATIFLRDVQDINQHIGEERSSQFLDMKEDGSLDADAQNLLTGLKDKITQTYSQHVKIHRLDWSKNIVDAQHRTHVLYLEDLCEQFLAVINHQILQSLSRLKQAGDEYAWLLQEVIHHTSLSQKKRQVFCGRQELLLHINQVVQKEDACTHSPLIIFGPSGTGKTALICKVSECVRDALGGQAVVALRLLGTSPLSSQIHTVLVNICFQVCVAVGLPPPSTQVTNSYNDTVRFFHRTLLEVSGRDKESLVLIFDSLDQLSPADGAHRLHWLPKECPPRVHIIVSTLPQEYDILQTLRETITSPESYLQVEPLSPEQGGEMMEMLLASARRRLNSAQQTVILRGFQECGQPLLLKLAFDDARRWASYTVPSEQEIATSTRTAVRQLYGRLEKLHGKILVSHALGYIVSSKNGLSETELKDVLSLDDEALSDIYQYWAPPSNDVIRLPPLLWTRLRFDLGEYLVDRQADGYTVMGLYHRQFIEVVQECYLSAEEKRRRHATLADFFQGNWSLGARKHISLPFLKKSLNADRKVAPQPLWFADEVPNLRKLSELPYHLFNAGRLEELKKQVLGSMDWISCKIVSSGIKSVIEDFVMSTDSEDCDEMALIRDTLLLFKPTIDFIDGQVEESIIYTEVLARLHFFASSYPSFIGELCRQCTSWFNTYPHPTFIPKCGFFQPPGGPLRTTLTGFSKGITVMELSAEHKLLLVGSQDGSIIVWNVKDVEVIHTLSGHSAEVLCVRVFGRGTRAVSGSLDNTLRLWNLVTGKEWQSIQEDHHEWQSSWVLHVDEKSNVIFSASGSQINIWNLETGEPVFQVSSGAPDQRMCAAVFAPWQLVMAVTEGGILRLWDSCTGEPQGTHQLPGLSEGIPTCGAMIQKHGKMAIGFSNSHLSMVSSDGSTAVELLPSPVKFVTVSENEELFLAGFGRYVRTYHSDSKAFRRLQVADLEHNDDVETAVISTHRSVVITGSRDETIRVWSLSKSGELLDSFDGMGMPVTLLALYETTLVSASRNAYYLKVWNLAYDQKHKTVPPFQDRTECTTLSNGGDLVYFLKTGDKHKIIIWNSLEGKTVDTLDASAEVCCLEVAPKKKLLFSGLVSGTVLIFPLPSRQDVTCLPPPECQQPISSIAVSKQEERLALAYQDFILVFTIGTETPCPAMEGPVYTIHPKIPAALTRVAILAGCQVIYGSAQGDLAVFECETATTVPLEGHGSKVTCLETSHGEHLALSGSEDSIQRLWNLELKEWEHEMCYKGFFFQGVQCACFSVDDKYIFTGAKDRSIKVWDVSSGALLAVQYVYASVSRIVATPGGFIATTRLGYVIRERFRSPQTISPKHNPLQNIRATCTVKSKTADRLKNFSTDSKAGEKKRNCNQGWKTSQTCMIV